MPPTLFLVAVSYESERKQLDFAARLKQAEQLAILNYPGHAANDARTVVAELLASACRTANCWPRDARTGSQSEYSLKSDRLAITTTEVSPCHVPQKTLRH